MGLGKKSETVATTKEADRLYIAWQGMAKRVRAMGLVNLKVESLTDKSFRDPGDQMAKTKKAADWIWQFDYDAFYFEFNLVVGSGKTLIASAKMNTIADVQQRAEILDSLRVATSMVTKSDIDKYMAEMQARAAKRADIQKIDHDIEQAEYSIHAWHTFMSNLGKSIEDLDRGQREIMLEPVAAKLGLGGYVRFVYSLDSGFNAYALMKGHFVKGASYPLKNFPASVTATLVAAFGPDQKGNPDFKPARKLAVQVVDSKVMPAYRTGMAHESKADIKAKQDLIAKLKQKRVKQLGG